MSQFLVFLASAAVLCCWVMGWGILATGSLRAGFRYVRLWLAFMVALVAIGSLGWLIVLPVMPG